MEITNSYMSQFYAASMYMSANSAISNAYQLAGANGGVASSAASFQADSASMPSRRLDRSDPASPDLNINVYGADGRTVSGVMDRPEVVLGNNPVLPSELSAEGLPDQPQLLFTHLANGLFDQNAQNISQNLGKAQEFSEELASDAGSMKEILQSVSEEGLQATQENTEDEQVSEQTADRLTDAANRFTNQYNETMQTLSHSPNRSRQVASIERVMESAVTNNMDELGQMGMTQKTDGTLDFNEDRFRQALNENPQSVNNVFAQDSNLTQGINRAMDAAENTRVIRNAEFSNALPSSNHFNTYQGTVQSSSMVSMANIPTGYFVNRLA